MPNSAPPAPPGSFFRKPTFWLLVLLALAIAARAWLLFRTALVPGMNGAYYLVQARALLEHGRLGIPDLPLTFWLQAGLARLCQLVTGLPPEDAILLTVKLADSVLPPLVAIPLARLALQWTAAGERASTLALLAPAAAAALGAQALRMAGDFQKNSLALVWFAALAPAALVFLRRPSRQTMLAPLVLLALLGLTHIGVLGGALVFCGLLALAALATAERTARRHILLLLGLGASVLGLAGGTAYALYDPARVTRLVTAFTQPASFGTERPPGAPDPPLDFAADDDTDLLASFDVDDAFTEVREHSPRPPAGFGGPAGGPPAGPSFHPGAPGPQGRLPEVLCVGVSVAALWILWRQRRHVGSADFSVVFAAAVTGLVLAAPLFDAQKAERLRLIATVPVAIAGSFVITRVVVPVWSRALGAGVFLFVLTDAARTLSGGAGVLITRPVFDELVALRAQCPQPQHTLVVARHGLEWWAAWTLRTNIAQPQAVTATDWARYSQVLYLSEKAPLGPPRGFPGLGAPHGVHAEPGMSGETEWFAHAEVLHEGAALKLVRLSRAPVEWLRVDPMPAK
ncbi:MAG: hypothetical protein QM691_09470 [Opitutaceae bacterium]